VNTTARRPTAKQIEDLAAEVHHHARQAADHASVGNYRKAHAEAETAQGLARRLKELLGSSLAKTA
jgi:hypothetical protein